jgi:hypothetical protein
MVFAAAARAGSEADPYDGSWHFLVTPYIWTPRIDGTLNFATGTGIKPVVSITPIDYLDNLNVPLMLMGEVRRGMGAIATDFVFVDFSGEKAEVKSIGGPGGNVEIPIDTGSTVGLRGTIWTLDGCYTVWRGETATLDVLGGFRYFRVEASLDWDLAAAGLLPQSGSHSQTENLWNGVAGIRGRVGFGGSRWFVPYYADVGTGSSDWTWLGTAGIGCAFGWGDMLLSYRDVVFDAGETNLIERLRLTGPALGVGIRF